VGTLLGEHERERRVQPLAVAVGLRQADQLAADRRVVLEREELVDVGRELVAVVAEEMVQRERRQLAVLPLHELDEEVEADRVVLRRDQLLAQLGEELGALVVAQQAAAALRKLVGRPRGASARSVARGVEVVQRREQRREAGRWRVPEQLLIASNDACRPAGRGRAPRQRARGRCSPETRLQQRDHLARARPWRGSRSLRSAGQMVAVGGARSSTCSGVSTARRPSSSWRRQVAVELRRSPSSTAAGGLICAASGGAGDQQSKQPRRCASRHSRAPEGAEELPDPVGGGN
jgi:hypothetical protein